MKILTPLWEHQNDIIALANREFDRRGYCFWQAGCAVGKTLSVLSLIADRGFKRTLVFTTKAGITSAWMGDVSKHTEGLKIVPLLKGSSKQKAAQMKAALLATDEPVLVAVNYETAWRMADDIKAMGFDFVVADESHELKSHDSKQSNVLAMACIGIPYKLNMTGTAWDDRPTDVFGQYRFLDSYVSRKRPISNLLDTWPKFFEKYVEYYRTGDGLKIPKGYKNLETLAEIINPFTAFVDSEKVLTLPPVLDIDRMVQMSPEMKRAYSDMSKDMLAEFSSGKMIADNVLIQTLRLHQLTGGFWTDYDLKDARPIEDGDGKVDELEAILAEIAGHPTVVFTQFTADVDKIMKRLAKVGIEGKKLVGGCHQHVEWQAGEGSVLVANMSAGSSSVNLTRARYAIYYSIGHSRTNYTQSRWRIRRPGSDLQYPITNYHIKMQGTIDEAIYAALAAKGDVADLLMGYMTNRIG